MHAVHSLGTIVQFCSNLQFSILYRHHFLHIEVHRKTVLLVTQFSRFLFLLPKCNGENKSRKLIHTLLASQQRSD
ncbi:hypothetical protein L3X38_038862 [Prunus dulcis]|uniref:Uncharacterized protein n=1 Tax=Prunus dulcis TaxID=3755 RepID=A0AAD4V5Z5_PRUDU|nr:hypothetical protein L3X38_038862 [Prunus dulcis]